MQQAEQHFARVLPIVGDSVHTRRVAVVGLPAIVRLVELLAACGIGRWLWLADPATPHARSERGGLLRHLLAQHGAALHLDVRVCTLDPWWSAMQRESPDLVIGAGSAADLQLALESGWALSCPVLLVRRTAEWQPTTACIWLPGDDPAAIEAWVASLPAVGAATFTGSDDWSWNTAAPLIAGLARALLLRETDRRRMDLEQLLADGRRMLAIGGAHPFDLAWLPIAGQVRSGVPPQRFRTPPQPRGRLLIAGLGSLGSVAAMHLARSAAGFVLADPETVDVWNPVRQAYPRAAVGRPKAQALRDLLQAAGAADVLALDHALTAEPQIAELIRQQRIDAAFVATGTSADFALARVLREHTIPHVVGRCYPRARYWEAIIVDGGAGPAFEDLRGGVVVGPAPRPTPEQLAAYSDAGALEAEPATLVESGWAAAWMARIAAQLLVPPGLREHWLLELLDAQQTCLLGGVELEQTDDGPAYGITQPGMVRALTSAQVRSPNAVS